MPVEVQDRLGAARRVDPRVRRQNQAIRRAWGEGAVPVCEEIPGRHHRDILADLATPGTRLHALARCALGLG